MTELSPNSFRTATAQGADPIQLSDYLPDPATAIVVPCYNEALRLDQAAFLDFLDETPRVSLIFVNDGSKDATQDMLLELQAACPNRIEVLSLSRNSGKAEAVRQGLRHAIDRGNQLVGYWDADLATPLDAIPDFMRVAKKSPKVQVIFGSRRQMLGHRINRTLFRRTVSQVCAGLARLAIRMPVGDTQCGAKLLRVSPELKDAVARPFTAGWLFDVELFSRISSLTPDLATAFYEQPLMEWTEIPGSKISPKVIVKSGLRMLRLIAEMRLSLAAVPAAADADLAEVHVFAAKAAAHPAGLRLAA